MSLEGYGSFSEGGKAHDTWLPLLRLMVDCLWAPDSSVDEEERTLGSQRAKRQTSGTCIRQLLLAMKRPFSKLYMLDCIEDAENASRDSFDT
jgi:hypothetical protein